MLKEEIMSLPSLSISPIYLFTNGYCDLYARYLVQSKICDKVVGLFIDEEGSILIHAFGSRKNKLYDILGETSSDNVIDYMQKNLSHLIKDYNLDELYIDTIEYDDNDKRMLMPLLSPATNQYLGCSARKAINFFMNSLDYPKPDYLYPKKKSLELGY